MPGTWITHPKTGFLEANYHQSFSSDLKEKLLEYLEHKAFRIMAACETVGITTATFYHHMRDDPVFAQCVQRVKHLRIEEVEQTLADAALKPEKTIDRIFFLKCHKPDVYNPAQHIEYKNETKLIVDDALGYIKRQKILEAEIVKERNKAISDGKDTTICSPTDLSSGSPSENI